MTSRRHFLYGAAAIAMAAQSGFAFAQEWKPTKDVEFVIPFAVGGGADIMARVIHKVITEAIVQPRLRFMKHSPTFFNLGHFNSILVGSAVNRGFIARSFTVFPRELRQCNKPQL